MTRERLLSFHEGFCSHARELMVAKNNDYAGDQAPFTNLELVEALTRGQISTETGIVIRLADKISRLAQAASGDLKVKDESAEDTLRDIVNYCVLFAAKREERRWNQR